METFSPKMKSASKFFEVLVSCSVYHHGAIQVPPGWGQKKQGRRVEVDLGIVCGWMRGRGWILLGTFSCSVAIKRQLTLLTWVIMRPDRGPFFNSI